MRLKFEKRNRAVIAECVWQSWRGSWKCLFLFPTMMFHYLDEGCWTVDILWLKLVITFGYVKIKYTK